MNLRKVTSFALVTALCVMCISGCSSKALDETENTTAVEVTTSSATDTMPISSNLLENVTLSLPENITVEIVSETREYFKAGGDVIGGIEILDVAGQRDVQPDENEYADFAISVTKQVQDGEYDHSVNLSSGVADVVVDIKFLDSRTFEHYFFFGEKVVYDVWADSDVMDGQDMISILKTLHSDDIVNPQDTAPVNKDVPILNLRTDLPDGIQRMPATTTRLLFYNIPSLDEYVTGENVAGGIEYVADGTDMDTLESVIAALGQEYFGGQYEAAAQEFSNNNVIAKVTANSSEVKVLSYIVQVDDEVYAVWADTAIITEENILKIAESCSY